MKIRPVGMFGPHVVSANVRSEEKVLLLLVHCLLLFPMHVGVFIWSLYCVVLGVQAV